MGSLKTNPVEQIKTRLKALHMDAAVKHLSEAMQDPFLQPALISNIKHVIDRNDQSIFLHLNADRRKSYDDLARIWVSRLAEAPMGFGATVREESIRQKIVTDGCERAPQAWDVLDPKALSIAKMITKSFPKERKMRDIYLSRELGEIANSFNAKDVDSVTTSNLVSDVIEIARERSKKSDIAFASLSSKLNSLMLVRGYPLATQKEILTHLKDCLDACFMPEMHREEIPGLSMNYYHGLNVRGDTIGASSSEMTALLNEGSSLRKAPVLKEFLENISGMVGSDPGALKIYEDVEKGLQNALRTGFEVPLSRSSAQYSELEEFYFNREDLPYKYGMKFIPPYRSSFLTSEEVIAESRQFLESDTGRKLLQEIKENDYVGVFVMNAIRHGVYSNGNRNHNPHGILAGLEIVEHILTSIGNDIGRFTAMVEKNPWLLPHENPMKDLDRVIAASGLSDISMEDRKDRPKQMGLLTQMQRFSAEIGHLTGASALEVMQSVVQERMSLDDLNGRCLSICRRLENVQGIEPRRIVSMVADEMNSLRNQAPKDPFSEDLKPQRETSHPDLSL